MQALGGLQQEGRARGLLVVQAGGGGQQLVEDGVEVVLQAVPFQRAQKPQADGGAELVAQLQVQEHGLHLE